MSSTLGVIFTETKNKRGSKLKYLKEILLACRIQNTMNILFVCKWNRFRSRTAEAYFKKINKNKSIKVKSAGIIQGAYPIDKQQYKIAKEFNININGKPQGISTELLKWQDIVIIVANDVPPKIFKDNKYKKKILIWKIKDENYGNANNIRRIINKILKKVEQLNKKLQ